MPLAYNLLLLLTSPLLALYLFYRLVVLGKSREGFPQRLGLSPRLPRVPGAPRIWLHAVSAGEMVAAAAISRRVRELLPDAEIVVSTTTPAGRQQAERLFPDAVARFYFPFDFLPCVALSLWRVRPTVIATVETEIWPNWLWLARLCGIRTALVNGQFADRGFQGARKARWLYRWALGRLEGLWMQSAQAAERARYLGAPAERVRVVGNAKFEQVIPPLRPEVAGVVRKMLDLDRGRPLLVAGSTHPGEEEQVLAAFRAARVQLPDLALLLAPRHLTRLDDVCRLLERDGWEYARRSGTAPGPVDVLVLDTMGELAGLYNLAEVVYMGGSLVPIGGHDILQPLSLGKPTLFGPHMHNQHDLADLALRVGAAVQVENSDELAQRVVSLSTDRALREETRRAAERLLTENTGAALECAKLLAALARGDRPPVAEQRVVTA